MNSKIISVKDLKQLLNPNLLASNVRSALGTPSALRIKHKILPPKPSEMIIDLSAACNAQCPFCPRVYMPKERSKGFMSQETFNKCIEEALVSGIKTIRLYSTAEPTLHPRFSEYIDQLVALGFYIEVSTNAFTLNKNFDALLKVDYLQYSIEGWDKESYEKFRFPLKFDKVRKNISDFWEFAKGYNKRPFINCNLLITQSTNLLEFIECWGQYVDEIKVNPLLGTTYFKDGKFLTENPIEIAHDYYEAEKKQDFVCYYPFNIVTVAFDGKIALCCADFSAELPLGSIFDGIQNIFFSKIFKEVRENFYSGRHSTCYDCNAFLAPTKTVKQNLDSQIEGLNHPFASKIKACY